MDSETITRLQSATVRAALKGAALNIATAILKLTGWAFDIKEIETVMDCGVETVVNLISFWYYAQAYKGRINATAVIEPVSLKEEIKSITKKA